MLGLNELYMAHHKVALFVCKRRDLHAGTGEMGGFCSFFTNVAVKGTQLKYHILGWNKDCTVPQRKRKEKPIKLNGSKRLYCML